MSTILFFLLLTVVVGLHEYAHLWAAQRLRVPVEKFALGFGPVLLKTTKGGIEYSLRALPLGGFVRFEDGYSENTVWWKKILIALAGPVANIITALLAFFVVMAVSKGPAVATEGLFSIIGMIGSLYMDSFTMLFNAITFHPSDDLSGPVGIAKDIHTSVGERGPILTTYIMFVALNLGLGMLNLVPIPILDGGRVVIAALEPVIGKAKALAFDRKFFTPVGAAAMLILLVVITFKDIFHH